MSVFRLSVSEVCLSDCLSVSQICLSVSEMCLSVSDICLSVSVFRLSVSEVCLCHCLSVSEPKPKKVGGRCAPADGASACDDANAVCSFSAGANRCECGAGFSTEEDFTCSTCCL